MRDLNQGLLGLLFSLYLMVKGLCRIIFAVVLVSWAIFQGVCRISFAVGALFVYLISEGFVILLKGFLILSVVALIALVCAAVLNFVYELIGSGLILPSLWGTLIGSGLGSALVIKYC